MDICAIRYSLQQQGSEQVPLCDLSESHSPPARISKRCEFHCVGEFRKPTPEWAIVDTINGPFTSGALSRGRCRGGQHASIESDRQAYNYPFLTMRAAADSPGWSVTDSARRAIRPNRSGMHSAAIPPLPVIPRGVQQP
jgi:hypothetical protein